MAEITSPHDSLFRQLLSSRETARDLLRSYLPEPVHACLDLDSLEVTGDSFVDPELRRHVSDLVYRVNLSADAGLAYLYLLFEHKSQPDPLVALQLLRYMSRLWERMLDQGRRPPLPPVVPLVFYHGRTRWQVSTEFSALIQCPTELAQYTPRFGYALLDLSLKGEAEVRGEAILRAMLLAMRHAFDEDLANRIPAILSSLTPVLATRTGLQALEALLRYFSAVGKRVDEHVLRDAVKQVVPAQGDTFMATLAEKWIKEGMEQGVQQGLQQGLEQGSIATAQEFLVELLQARFGRVVAAPLCERVRNIDDLAVLRVLLKAAATAGSAEVFASTLALERSPAAPVDPHTAKAAP